MGARVEELPAGDVLRVWQALWRDLVRGGSLWLYEDIRPL